MCRCYLGSGALGDLNLKRCWRGITLLLLTFALLRMFALVLHTPTLGYANQYDMLRVSACLDLWPGSKFDNLSDAALQAATFDAPQPIYQRRVFDRHNCYWSSDVGLSALAMQTQQLLAPHPNADIDLRWIGGVKTAVLVAAMLWLNGLFWLYPRAAVLHALIAALVLADPFVMLYANTLYTEFGAVLGAYLAIAAAAGLSLTLDQASVKPRTLQWQVALVLGLALLGCARVPHAPLALALALVVLWFFWRQLKRFPYQLAFLLLLPLALGTSVAVRNQHALIGVSQANATNTLFFTILPAADDPRALAQDLGLRPTCGEMAFSSWYLKRATDVARDCPEAYQFSRARLAWVLITQPKIGLRVLANGLAQSRGWRVAYIGEVAGTSWARAPFWSLANLVPRLPYFVYLGLALFVLSLTVLGVCKPAAWAQFLPYRTQRCLSTPQRLLLAQLGVVAVLPLLIALLGDGYTELPRHAHLSTVALPSLLLVLLGCGNHIGIVRGISAALLSTLLLFLISRQPAAISAWEHPLSAPAQQNFEVSGWVLDAFGASKVYGAGPNQIAQPLLFTARKDLTTVFQGYPNADHAGVRGVLKISPPYTEIRVRNNLGVESVVDRIWVSAAESSEDSSKTAPTILPK
jgi:hypothetical protein